MNLSLNEIYAKTDVAGAIYAANTKLSGEVCKATTRISSIGQSTERPPSKVRLWAARAAATAAVTAWPVTNFLPIAALTFGTLGIVTCGIGRDKSRPPQANLFKRGFEIVRANGLVGLPEYGALRLAHAAERRGYQGVFNIFMGVAIGLGALAQVVRASMAAAAYATTLADGLVQATTALFAAAFGIMSERYHRRGAQAS